jgi:5-formyltetrahydrofolate cyclo-ligase
MTSWEQVRCWRKDQRTALIEQRLAIPREDRVRWSGRITTRVLYQFNRKRPALLGLYWPFKGEYDPRPSLNCFIHSTWVSHFQLLSNEGLRSFSARGIRRHA